STIVVTANGDVGPTPYYIRIYDTSTSTTTLLATCGTGTTCSVSVTRPTPAVGNFQGRITDFAGNVVPGSQSATIAVNWQGVTLSAAGWRVSLSANPSPFTFGTTVLTANTNGNVGPTPYFIQIFNENGTRVAICGSGTSCAATVTPAFPPGSNYVAFISDSAS